MDMWLYESNDIQILHVELTKNDVEKILKEKFGELILNIKCSSASFEVKTVSN